MKITEFIAPIEQHETLNQKLWEGNDLRPEVHAKLLEIAKEFYEYLDVDVEVQDLVISGSQANFNYSPYSDLDLHLIVNYGDVQCDLEVDELFDTKRKLWKEQHDINIRGIPVELYVEDSLKPAVSSIYSLLNRKWIKKPNPQSVTYNKSLVVDEVKKWNEVIDHALKTKNLDVMRKVKDMLKDFRQGGLDSGGEFSIENLTYKSLRNSGKISDLMKAIVDIHDRQLSI
jgi:hypothetical protein